MRKGDRRRRNHRANGQRQRAIALDALSGEKAAADRRSQIKADIMIGATMALLSAASKVLAMMSAAVEKDPR